MNHNNTTSLPPGFIQGCKCYPWLDRSWCTHERPLLENYEL